MKIYNNILLKGLAAGAVLLTASCSDGYLNTSPNEYLDEDAVSGAMQKDPSKVQAYVTGAYFNLYCGGDYATSQDNMGYASLRFATELMCEDLANYYGLNIGYFDYQLDFRQSNYRRTVATWRQLYNVIDNANTIITMLKPAEGESLASAKAEAMLGEAYTLRAFCYYWLINLYQQPLSAGADQPGIPLKTEVEYRPERVPVGEVYTQILSDIDNGYKLLEGKGFHSGKGSLSEYSAAAIYANILMFTGNYGEAAAYAEKAIAGASFNTTADMLGGYNSLDLPEVLWGYRVNVETTCFYGSWMSVIDCYSDGYAGGGFTVLGASDLVDRIADGDVRKGWFGYVEDYNEVSGIDFTLLKNVGGRDFTVYLPDKYRDVYVTSGGTAEPFTSDVIYLTAAEMYYVAAEAYYLDNKPDKAKDKLEAIMSSRKPGYACSLSGDALYEEICWQKRIDTWGEGCRYFDAKRRNETIDRAKSVNYDPSLAAMDAVTYSARDYRMIYQLPTVEMENNPDIPAGDNNK